MSAETQNIFNLNSEVISDSDDHRGTVSSPPDGLLVQISGLEPQDDDTRDTHAFRKRRREWIQQQLASVQKSGQLPSSLEYRQVDESCCWICARRGQFKFCPQVSSKDYNPRIIIEDHLSAAFFASEVANPRWQPGKQRLVFYTDMAAINGTGHDPDIAGAAVTYKSILGNGGDGVSSWSDASYGIIGSNRPDKVELYAIGLALEIAVSQIQTTLHDPTVHPTVLIITDSQAALYFIHDFMWQGTIPFLFSQETFANLMKPISTLNENNIPIEFHWAPSHTDIEGNSRADKLAGAASNWTLSRIPRKHRRKLLTCHVIRIPSSTHSWSVPVSSIIAMEPRRVFLERSPRSLAAEQIEAMQAEWISDQMADVYRSSSLSEVKPIFSSIYEKSQTNFIPRPLLLRKTSVTGQAENEAPLGEAT
ncbi:hypothetical protein TruAng_009926 [Truncatella angustata]|nr:hypothetical protein TruAng_009926 [Truncatella angustata]